MRLFILFFISLPLWAAELEIIDPWVRAMPPNMRTSAAFMLIKNSSDQPKKLIAAQSEQVGMIELHTHIHDNGVMRMRQVEFIEVPAQGQVELKPGSYHLMLMMIKKPIQEGDVFPLKLQFDDGSQIEVQASVRRMP